MSTTSPWHDVLDHCLSTISAATAISGVISRIASLDVDGVHAIIHSKAPTIVITPKSTDDLHHLTLLKESLIDILPVTTFVTLRHGDFWKLRTTTENNICIEIITTIPNSKPVDLKL